MVALQRHGINYEDICGSHFGQKKEPVQKTLGTEPYYLPGVLTASKPAELQQLVEGKLEIMSEMKRETDVGGDRLCGSQ